MVAYLSTNDSPGANRFAELSPKSILKPVEVLNGERLIKAVSLAYELDNLGWHTRCDERVNGITGSKM
jgi:hypothetical protein